MYEINRINSGNLVQYLEYIFMDFETGSIKQEMLSKLNKFLSDLGNFY